MCVPKRHKPKGAGRRVGRSEPFLAHLVGGGCNCNCNCNCKSCPNSGPLSSATSDERQSRARGPFIMVKDDERARQMVFWPLGRAAERGAFQALSRSLGPREAGRRRLGDAAIAQLTRAGRARGSTHKVNSLPKANRARAARLTVGAKTDVGAG